VRLQFTNLLVADLDSLGVLGVIEFGAHGQAVRVVVAAIRLITTS
jgi:hypothetical protein